MKNMLNTTKSFGRALIAALALGFTGRLGFAADDHYYINDPLATTVAITDSAGEIAAMEADAFGAPLAIGEAPGRFTGKPYDADLGAYVFPFRNYRPEEGRWMSADPSGFPDGANNRFYISNPAKYVDPLGLYSCEWDSSVNAADKSLIESAFTSVTKRITALDSQINDINTNGPNTGYISKDQTDYGKEVGDLTQIVLGIKAGLAGSSKLRIKLGSLGDGVDATMTTYPFGAFSPLLTLDSSGSWRSGVNGIILHELSHIQGTEDNETKGQFMNAHNFDNLMGTDIRSSVTYKFLLKRE